MQWEFTNDREISLQIVEIVQKGILSGVYPPGSSLPSVRVLAVEAGVNPNTMQKALVELEARGLVHTQRNSGRTVTDDERLIMKLKQQAAASYVEQFFADMRNLGFERADAAAILKSQATSPLEEVG